jgi:hypothetical protein
MLTKYINCENQSDPKHVYCLLDFYMSFDAIRVPFSLSTNFCDVCQYFCIFPSCLKVSALGQEIGMPFCLKDLMLI